MMANMVHWFHLLDVLAKVKSVCLLFSSYILVERLRPKGQIIVSLFNHMGS